MYIYSFYYKCFTMSNLQYYLLHSLPLEMWSVHLGMSWRKEVMCHTETPNWPDYYKILWVVTGAVFETALGTLRFMQMLGVVGMVH